MIRLKTIFSTLCVLVIFTSGIPAFAADTGIEKLTTEKDKVSYALGVNLGTKIQADYPLNLDAFFQGIRDCQSSTKLLTDDQIQKSLMTFQQQMQQKQMESLKTKSADNKAAGQSFLESNKSKQGIVSLPSGLQYKILKKGDGPSPKASDTVSCHYKGTTIDGKEFDSSYKRGKPASFKVSGVIKGWTEALQLMKVGSKWMLYIPSDLAYGDRGAGRSIEPGSTLIFEVELLGIEK